MSIVTPPIFSWEAVYRLHNGAKIDLRQVCSAVGGDEASRHGIILAKSQLAKKAGVQTGEPLFMARQKCANVGEKLILVPPRYDLYLQCSNAMIELLKEYTPFIQRYSVDECFLDFTNAVDSYSEALALGHRIKDRIKKELGFCVSVGISSNKLLAKTCSEFGKDSVHTLYPFEIEEKMWPLPIEDLFMVGRKTKAKLINNFGINTIGDLANFNVDLLKYKLKSHGELIWQYANGIEASEVRKSNFIEMKGMGNSTTSSWNIEDEKEARLFILSLSETLGMRLRNSHNLCSLVAISIRYSDFRGCSKQRKLASTTNVTSTIAETAFTLFKELWDGMPIRHIGVSISHLSKDEYTQLTLFDEKNIEKKKKLR
ncbi:DNA polymerase IV [Clostridium sp. BL8]|uniref:DNA polymerase Y family protein n=1 Tax=Clostridium sp. BL8 TaxID=1354301 RepID=UPI00325B15E0